MNTMTKEIILEVEPTAAEIFGSANTNEKDFLQALVNSLLVRKKDLSKVHFKKLMDNISNDAELAGLTPEKLNKILNDK